MHRSLAKQDKLSEMRIRNEFLQTESQFHGLSRIFCMQVLKKFPVTEPKDFTSFVTRSCHYILNHAQQSQINYPFKDCIAESKSVTLRLAVYRQSVFVGAKSFENYDQRCF
jgi:hypothetical protein